MLTIDEAIRYLRSDPKYAEIVKDSYVSRDVCDSARRFAASPEFAEVARFLESLLVGGSVLDLGAGTGIAAYAFCLSGAARVYALEPDPSDEVGRGAMRRLPAGLPIQIMEAWGEAIPLPDESVHIVYNRQVLHHAGDLNAILKECARVLRPGGIFLACREHVVDNARQLRKFLRSHLMHQLTGGENAFPLETYLSAIRHSGLIIERVLGPYDTVINTFPAIKARAEIEVLPRTLLERRLGKLGRAASYLPLIDHLIWKWLKRPIPGRLYSFLARKNL